MAGKGHAAMTNAELRVACYSSHTYAQEPRSFVWQGHEHSVASVESVRRVLDEPRATVTLQFTVITTDRSRFRLCYDETGDAWTAEAL